MMLSFKIILAALAAAASTAVRATPFADGPTQNDVFNPHITFPTAGVTWPVGSDQVVTWNTSSIPASNANQTGFILLGYLENDSENLDIDNPLATGFPISAGSVGVIVPNVTARDDYVVVLFGDSGNVSPEFTISS